MQGIATVRRCSRYSLGLPIIVQDNIEGANYDSLQEPIESIVFEIQSTTGVNFCQACGAAATSLGVATTVQSRQSPPAAPVPSQQVPVSAPMYPNSSTQAGTKFVNVVKPQLNQQAIKSGLMSSLRAQQQQRIPATVTSGLMAASGVLLGFGLSLVMLNVVDSGYDEPNFFVAALVGVFCLFWGGQYPAGFLKLSNQPA